MGFSVKVAPGVRVRASSRGVRTSIGPRAARVRVGGGRTGFSTGVGPVSAYTSARGPRRTSSSRGRKPSISSLQRQAAAAQKAEEAERLAGIFSEILSVHQQEFPPAQRPLAPSAVLPDESKIRSQHERIALQGIGLFKRAERAGAKQRAAASDFAALKRQAEWDASQAQAVLDQHWQQLLANEANVVIATLPWAFTDEIEADA
jgi:hypothetical protein